MILVVKLLFKREKQYFKALRQKSLGLFCFSLLIFIPALNGCSSKVSQLEQQKIAGTTMGTSYSVQFYFSQAQKRVTAQQKTLNLKFAVEQRLEAIEQSMSTYRKNSEISLLNQSKVNEWQAVSKDLMFVLQAAQSVSELTQGVFDVTVGPLVNLWGFGPEYSLRDKPKQVEISNLLKQGVGYQFLKLDQNTLRVKKLKPLKVDLSAIAKGYAVDSIAKILSEQGIENYLVEIGGELKASGYKPNKQQWRVAVEKPILDVLATQREIESVLPLFNIAIASSGDYRNYFEQDGIVYSHTINPKTGMPVSHGLASVSVLHDSCMQADALATAFMVLGPKKTLLLANEQGLPVLLIVREADGYSEHISFAMKAFITEQKPLQ
jgi:thiamine biosynthesis lipoprotein